MYRFVARGTRYPETSFYFWEGQLAKLHSETNRKKEGQTHFNAGLVAGEKLRARYGSVRRELSDQYANSADWQLGDVVVSLSADNYAHLSESGLRRPVASLRIEQKVQAAYEKWREWGDRVPDPQPGVGPLVAMFCLEQGRTIDDSEEDIVMFIDTRGLTEIQARRVLKRKEKESTVQGYSCTAEIRDDARLGAEANLRAAKRRQAHTYLHYTDENGLIVTQRFRSANVNSEDSVCEEHREPLALGGHTSAECITGTAVWQNAP